MANVEKSATIGDKIDLPSTPMHELYIVLTGEPTEIETVNGPAVVVDVETFNGPVTEKGYVYLPKSLRYNMATAIKRNGDDPTTFQFEGSKWKVTRDENEGKTYYHARMIH